MRKILVIIILVIATQASADSDRALLRCSNMAVAQYSAINKCVRTMETLLQMSRRMLIELRPHVTNKRLANQWQSHLDGMMDKFRTEVKPAFKRVAPPMDELSEIMR